MFLFVVWAFLLLVCSSSKADLVNLELYDLSATGALEIMSASTGISFEFADDLLPLPDKILPSIRFSWSDPCDPEMVIDIVRRMFEYCGRGTISAEKTATGLRFIPYSAEIEAIEALAKYNVHKVIQIWERNPEIEKKLEEVAADPGRPDPIRQVAMKTLNRIEERQGTGDRTNFWIMVAQNRDEPASLRIGAIEALSKKGTDGAVDVLLGILKDPLDQSLWGVTAGYLGNAGNVRAASPMVSVLQQGAADYAKQDIVVSLGQLGDEVALPVLRSIAAREDEDAKVREWAHCAIEMIELQTGSGSRIEAARRGLESQRDKVRYWAVQWIGKLGGPEDIPAVRAVLEDAQKGKNKGLYSETVDVLRQFGVNLFQEEEIDRSLYIHKD